VKKDVSLIESPTISVVMPVYNAQQDLHEAIESVLDQSFADFELLIIDDGSTDESVQIIRSFEDSRIRLISQPRNLGLVAALNKGLSEARGQFIARMDGDDICLPDRFVLQLQIMQDQQLDICGSHWAQIDESGHQLSTLYAPRLADEVIATLATTVPYAHGSVMIKKSFLDDHDLHYTPGFAEDYQLWIRLLECGAKFGIADKILYLHRTHQKSITQTKYREQAQAAKFLRRSFVSNNIPVCRNALSNLRDGYSQLTQRLRLHSTYLAYRFFCETGQVKFLLFFIFRSSPLNFLAFIRRVIEA
jgi:glycosyltransferase involved in cell wall biosynthesis